MNGPLVSIVIPVYNVEKYFSECVESVLSQTYGDLEIILVDDGSTDSSGRLCDGFAEKDGRIKVVHTENSGLSAARNNGFDVCAGKYVYFLDSDDYLDPDAIAGLAATAEKENADLVFFDAVSFIDGDENAECRQSYIRKSDYPAGKGFDVFGALQKNREFSSSVPLLFLNREFLEKNGLRQKTGIVYEDMIFTFEAFCLAEKAARNGNAYYHRRYRDNSIMTSAKKKKNFDSAVTVTEDVAGFCRAKGLDGTAAAREYTVRCALNVFNNYSALSDEDRKSCRGPLAEFKNRLKSNDYFGNAQLKMRCAGYAPWAAYKAVKKILH